MTQTIESPGTSIDIRWVFSNKPDSIKPEDNGQFIINRAEQGNQVMRKLL